MERVVIRIYFEGISLEQLVELKKALEELTAELGQVDIEVTIMPKVR